MLLIGNGRLITRTEEAPFLEDGSVAIDNGKIVKVGATADLKKEFPSAEFIDAKGGVIMPGFINMHNHIYSAFARGLSIKGNNPQNFMDILENQWWKIDRTLKNPDSYHSATISYVDAIRNGVTTMFDHHASYGEIEGSLSQLSRAADELGVRTCLCYEISDRDGEEKFRASVKENADFAAVVEKRTDEMQKAMIGMHAAFTLSDKSLEYAAANTPNNIGYHIHVAEGMDDVYDSLKKYNKPIINRLFEMNILGEKTMCGHCIHIGPHEMEILRDTNTMVVTNPESNMGNAVGCSPALKMFDYDILIGYGTDGYTNDLTESYKVANLIYKHHLCMPNVGWTEIPQMLFYNNPKMANRYFEPELGVLKEGAAGDVIVLEYQGPTPMTADNYNSHILFGMNGKSVTDTIINGKVRMRNRELVGVDEEKIWADARQQAQDLWNRINA